jgi:hypothetical protein
VARTSNVCLYLIFLPTQPIFFPKLQSWVGILLVTQPFFIGGIRNVEEAKGSAFGAAATFLVCFLASVSLMIRDTRRQLEYDSGFEVSGSLSVRSHGSASLHSQASGAGAAAAEWLGRGASLVPFPAGPIFHDYDPLHMDDRLDDNDRGVLS